MASWFYMYDTYSVGGGVHFTSQQHVETEPNHNNKQLQLQLSKGKDVFTDGYETAYINNHFAILIIISSNGRMSAIMTIVFVSGMNSRDVCKWNRYLKVAGNDIHPRIRANA